MLDDHCERLRSYLEGAKEKYGADSALVRLGAPVCSPLDNPEAFEDRHQER